MRLNKTKIWLEMERLGWSQAELARRMGVQRQYVNRFLRDEKQNAGLITINKIATTLGIDPKELLI